MKSYKTITNRSPPRPVPVPGSPHRGRPGRLRRPYVPLTPASVAVVASPGWNPVRGRYPSQMNLPGIPYGRSGFAGSSPPQTRSVEDKEGWGELAH